MSTATDQATLGCANPEARLSKRSPGARCCASSTAAATSLAACRFTRDYGAALAPDHLAVAAWLGAGHAVLEFVVRALDFFVVCAGATGSAVTSPTTACPRAALPYFCSQCIEHKLASPLPGSVLFASQIASTVSLGHCWLTFATRMLQAHLAISPARGIEQAFAQEVALVED